MGSRIELYKKCGMTKFLVRHKATDTKEDMALGNKAQVKQGKLLLDTEAVLESSRRNLGRGVWQLARLHTREAWLCWYPAGMLDLIESSMATTIQLRLI